MRDTNVVDVLRAMFTTGAKVAGPVVLTALVVGVFVSIAQTVTQVQEASVAFVLKLTAVVIVMLIAGPWMLQELRTFLTGLWAHIGRTT
jgi:flagellar biosynthesis protein FliQ